MSVRTASVSLALAVATAIAIALPARPAGPPRPDSVSEFLFLSLDMERKGALDDLEDFDRITARVARAEGDLSAAVQRLGRLAREMTADRQAVRNAEDALAEAEARVRAEEERRRALSARLAERVRKISALRSEILKRRETSRSADDPVSGRWEVQINPGPVRGIFQLVLDGTLVWGDYSLDGGFRGSFRGTLVGDRLSLDRIDSERGFDARFWGRLNAAQKRITGTWEATALAPAVGPVAGSWVANPAKEPEEEETP
ncbi:MAG: hypothetical protein ACHQPI_03010 [Thermoanaerobaculia bacterium]